MFWEGRYKTAPDFFGDMTPLAPLNGRTPENSFRLDPELTETEKVIFNRRSIRVFKKKPVPKETINRILEAARFAPSAGNGQPWKFIVVTDRSISERIDRECAKVLDKIVRPLRWKTGVAKNFGLRTEPHAGEQMGSAPHICHGKNEA